MFIIADWGGGAVKAEPENHDRSYNVIEISESEAKTTPFSITNYEKQTTTYHDPISGSDVEVYDLAPKDYRIDLKTADYGSGNDVKYFKWVQDKNGDYSLEKTDTEQDAQITVHYNTETNKRKKIDNNTEDINQEFVDLTFNGEKEQGGAVYNDATKNENINIKGDFIKNCVDKHVQGNGNAQGGAIANMWGSIGNIEGDFIGNYTHSEANSDSQGGAIANVFSTMGNIKGNFIGNYAYSDNGTYVLGGAITNDGINSDEQMTKIGNIEGNFAYNYARSINGWVRGGAIFNGSKAEIESIKGDFIGNYTKNETNSDKKSEGGAIANVYGTIGDITGNFIGNYTYSEGYALGGAIMSYDSKIGDIKGNFAYNYAYSTNGYASGGAIKNDGYSSKGEIGDIKGDFIENYAKGFATASGGAVFNENNAKIGNITGNFIENYAASDSEAHGGAVYNYTGSSIGEIKGNFIGNYSSSKGNISHGGAIDNFNSTIDNITGNFIKNYSQSAQNSFGGAIYNYNTAEYSSSTIGNLTGNFVENYVKAESGDAIGGAIYNQGAKIGNIEGNFYSNSAESASGQGQGGALANTGETGNIHGDFVSNSASSLGGALYNAGKIGETDNKGIYNSSFYNNSAGEHGGAIYTEKSLKLTADGYVSEFADNKANGESEAIYVGKAEAEDVILTLSTKEGGKFNFYDSINGTEGYKLNIEGDDSGEVNLYNKISNADIKHANVTTNVFDVKFLNNSNSLDMESGTLNINNFGLTQLNFRNFGIQGGTINIDSVDVNLADRIMGRITTDEYGETSTGGTINVNDLKVFADSTDLITPVKFAEESFANTVQSPVNEVYGPIFRYGVDYNSNGSAIAGSAGDFLFKRIGYNPAILASPVAQMAGGYASMVQSYKYAFEHADTFSMLPSSVRNAMLNSNRNAITEVPSYNNNIINRNGLWFRPYTSFESIPLKNGPKTSAILYGSYMGGDSQIFHMKNGWSNVYTGYIGYIGSSLNYQGNNTYQNGIVGGVTDTFYKNNFYTALTASVGSSIGETTTMYGDENFTMLMSGVASRTGYNFEFKEGGFIIQPNLLLSYTYINTFDYTNAANVRIKPEPLHAIQVHPYIKFIRNTKSGWQPYLAAGFVYNVMGQTQTGVSDLYGNNVQLPALSIKPYAEYGLGIQKLWNDKFTGFMQGMIRSGGRNGIAITLGFRWALGPEKPKKEPPKHEIKKPQKL